MRRIHQGNYRSGLARALSKLGYCSRSRACLLIRQGRVHLNGRVRHDPETPVNTATDRIEVDGRPVIGQEKQYLVLNKPRGLVTTVSDEKGRATIYACLEDIADWLAPVGRLDKASEGLLLLTNDSEWAARVISPETHLDKTYHVQVGTIADDALLRTLCQGVRMEDGAWLKAKQARLLRHGGRNSWLAVVLDEGKYRHIRRMLSALDVDVLRLVRVAIGPLTLGELPKGAHRPLTAREKQVLDEAMEQVPATRPSRAPRYADGDHP